MTQELRVETTELRSLATHQREAATALAAAARTTNGVGANVLSTHGVIATSTAMAVDAVDAARGAAAAAMQSVSAHMSESLTIAAARYDHTDGAEGRNLDRQIPTGGG